MCLNVTGTKLELITSSVNISAGLRQIFIYSGGCLKESYYAFPFFWLTDVVKMLDNCLKRCQSIT